MRNRTRWILFAILGLFFAIVISDSLGIYDEKPYSEIPHGDHSHYLPRDPDSGELLRDPDVPVGQFPTRPPGPNERITPRGEIVQK